MDDEREEGNVADGSAVEFIFDALFHPSREVVNAVDGRTVGGNAFETVGPVWQVETKRLCFNAVFSEELCRFSDKQTGALHARAQNKRPNHC